MWTFTFDKTNLLIDLWPMPVSFLIFPKFVFRTSSGTKFEEPEWLSDLHDVSKPYVRYNELIHRSDILTLLSATGVFRRRPSKLKM